MQVNIVTFGQIIDVTGKVFLVEEVTSTDALRNFLDEKYPVLTGLKYLIAVDENIVRTNVALTEKSAVALLPPFAGG